MRMRNVIYPLMQITLFTLTATTATAEDIAYIAGVNPSERPATAPVVTEVQHDTAWYSTVLQGVEQPYPSSLRFLESQGNWFSPFTHAGMPPPYDIRGWHTGE